MKTEEIFEFLDETLESFSDVMIDEQTKQTIKSSMESFLLAQDNISDYCVEWNGNDVDVFVKMKKMHEENIHIPVIIKKGL